MRIVNFITEKPVSFMFELRHQNRNQIKQESGDHTGRVGEITQSDV